MLLLKERLLELVPERLLEDSAPAPKRARLLQCDSCRGEGSSECPVEARGGHLQCECCDLVKALGTALNETPTRAATRARVLKHVRAAYEELFADVDPSPEASRNGDESERR